MIVVGVTGHSNIDEPTAHRVRGALTDVLAPIAGDLVGVTCLARGADQVFADVVLDLGGSLEVIVPSRDYFDKIAAAVARERCDAYLAAAAEVHRLPFEAAGHPAYLAASRALIDRCEVLVAVWDGSVASGTGEAVAVAREQGRRIVVVWPEGSRRAD